MIWVHADLYQCTLFSRILAVVVGGYLTENSSTGFQWGVFHFETIFSSPFLHAAPLTEAIFSFFFEIQLFSMLFDLRFAPNALSTEV